MPPPPLDPLFSCLCHGSVMVLKKLGDVLVPEFLAVVSYLALERRMNVVVEPALYQEMFHGGGDGRAAAEGMQFQPQLADHVYTWHPEDSGRWGMGGAQKGGRRNNEQEHSDHCRASRRHHSLHII